MALVTTMLVLLGIMTIMLLGTIGSNTGASNGVMTNVGNAMQQSNARLRSATAFNMAESGVEYTLQWLNTQPLPPNISAAYAPPLWGATASGSPARALVVPDSSQPNNSFSVVIYPDTGNSGNQQKKYIVESVGSSSGFKQIIQAYIEVTSLSKWLVLVNNWPNGNYWVSGISTFDGPVHDNNADGLNENVYWKSAATSPMWTYTGSDAYDVSGSGVNWYKNSWSTIGAPQTDSDWSKILAGGSNTLHTGSASVPFPTSSSMQMNAALNGTATPTTLGVTVPTGGGLYIHGDSQQMTLSVDGSGNQVITIQQTDSNGKPYTSVVTLNTQTNQTQVQVTSVNASTGKTQTATTNYAGTTNGVVYSDGNIGNQGDPKTGGLSGVVANNQYNSSGTLTHANNLNIVTGSGANLNIDGSITYQTVRQKDSNGNYLPESQDSNFTEYAGTLGIVSNTILITEQDASGNPLNNLEVDAAVLAYNTYDVDHYNSRPVGTWENMGGYLSANMGYFGVGDASGNMYSGMSNNFNYDARMANAPPPYFPTTGNVYDVLSWQRVNSTLQ